MEASESLAQNRDESLELDRDGEDGGGRQSSTLSFSPTVMASAGWTSRRFSRPRAVRSSGGVRACDAAFGHRHAHEACRLVATATTTYEEPFLVARKFASLDHISGGRAGWNLVTTSNAEDSLNFSRTDHMSPGTSATIEQPNSPLSCVGCGTVGPRMPSQKTRRRGYSSGPIGSTSWITRGSTSRSAGRSMLLAPRKAIL